MLTVSYYTCLSICLTLESWITTCKNLYSGLSNWVIWRQLFFMDAIKISIKSCGYWSSYCFMYICFILEKEECTVEVNDNMAAGNFRSSWEGKAPHLVFPNTGRSGISLERTIWTFRWSRISNILILFFLCSFRIINVAMMKEYGLLN